MTSTKTLLPNKVKVTVARDLNLGVSLGGPLQNALHETGNAHSRGSISPHPKGIR